MPAKKKKPSNSNPVVAVFVGATLLAVGVASGYVLRSYAPLPIPGNTPLSSNFYDEKEETVDAPPPTKAESRISNLEEKRREIDEELAEIQIKQLLGDE